MVAFFRSRRLGFALVTVLAFGLTVITAVRADAVRRDSSVDFLSNALRHIETEVLIGKDSYVVRHGIAYLDETPVDGSKAQQALSLAYRKVLAERSPLLTLAGSDTRALQEALDELEAVQEKLARIQSDRDEMRAVAGALYPIAFLRAAATLEDARVDFIAHPDSGKAVRYEGLLSAALRTYRSDLARFTKAFGDAVDEKTPRFVSAGRVLDVRSLEAAQQALERGIEKSASIHRMRRACFLDTSACTSVPLEFPVLDDITSMSSPAASLVDMRRVRGLFADLYEAPEILSSDIVALSDSSCLKPLGIEPIYTIYPESIADSLTVKIGTASDIRFTSTAILRDVGFYGYFYERNIPYVFATPLLHYACQEVGGDYGRTFAVRAVRDLIGVRETSGYEPSTATLALEADLKTADVLREDIAKRYVQLLLSDYDSLPDQLKSEAGSLALQLHNRSAALEETVRSIARSEAGDMRLLEKGVPADLSAQNLFFSRSAFLTLFLSHNLSVLQDERVSFEEISVPVEKQPYRYLINAPHTTVPYTRLLESLRAFFDLRS